MMIRNILAASLVVSASALAEAPPFTTAGADGERLELPEFRLQLHVPPGWRYQVTEPTEYGRTLNVQTPNYDGGEPGKSYPSMNEINCYSMDSANVPDGIANQEDANAHARDLFEKNRKEVEGSDEIESVKAASSVQFRDGKIPGFIRHSWKQLSGEFSGAFALDVFVYYLSPKGTTSLICFARFDKDAFQSSPYIDQLKALEASVTPFGR